MQRRKSGHEESWLLSYADLITNLLLFFVVLVTAASLSKGKMQQITKSLSGEETPASLSSIKSEIDEQIQEKQLKDMVQSTLTDEGLELTLNSGVVFDSGKANIRSEFDAALDNMLHTMVPYSSKYHFAVEGHTDTAAVMPGGPFPSNWELASARAIVVRQKLEDLGIDRGRIRVESYADTKPLPADQLAGLDAAQIAARHRRVVVRIF